MRYSINLEHSGCFRWCGHFGWQNDSRAFASCVLWLDSQQDLSEFYWNWDSTLKQYDLHPRCLKEKRWSRFEEGPSHNKACTIYIRRRSKAAPISIYWHLKYLKGSCLPLSRVHKKFRENLFFFVFFFWKISFCSQGWCGHLTREGSTTTNEVCRVLNKPIFVLESHKPLINRHNIKMASMYNLSNSRCN